MLYPLDNVLVHKPYRVLESKSCDRRSSSARTNIFTFCSMCTVGNHYNVVQVPFWLSAKNMCTVTVKTKGGGGRAARSLTATVEFAVVAGAGCATSPLFLLVSV